MSLLHLTRFHPEAHWSYLFGICIDVLPYWHLFFDGHNCRLHFMGYTTILCSLLCGHHFIICLHCRVKELSDEISIHLHTSVQICQQPLMILDPVQHIIGKYLKKETSQYIIINPDIQKITQGKTVKEKKFCTLHRGNLFCKVLFYIFIFIKQKCVFFFGNNAMCEKQPASNFFYLLFLPGWIC